ncbi:diguanylate cyclase [Clostridium sp.]|jgi:diguanylate cyclase (GGDEF)-like protein|uniref:diguanylate cyclase n=1 Tax=Clostridium sp. TaxID=1506 RepID=UPI003EEC43A1
MEIINNRYRIVKSIKQNRVVSSYVVNDIIKNYDTVQLNILNSEYIKKELIEFYTKEFISLTNLECKNIIALYEFDIVNLLDNKKLNEKVYFYTNEYVQNNSDILDIVCDMSSEEILNLFIDICQSINYLHLKAFNYGDINLSNIISENNASSKNHRIKFKDIATIELQKNSLWKDENNSDYFRAPELLEGKKTSASSDIYSLGILLILIYIKSNDSNFVIEEGINPINEFRIQEIFNNNEDYNVNIKRVIEKMICSDVTKRYETISDLIMDINIFFHKKYLPHRKEETEKLNFKLKMIGRDEEIYKIINVYESIKNKNNYNSTFLIHGESGIGKTRFLKGLKYILSLRKVNVYKSFILNASTKNSNKALVDILKQFISECETEVLERYESELVKFIPELSGKKNIIPTEPLSGGKERFRLINRTTGFIEECINNIPIVIIIDNFHLADDFTIELIEYLIRKRLPNKNIMVMMSYCDGECIQNKRFMEFTKNISKSSDVNNIFLKELGEKQVGIMIQNILSMPNIPNKFASSIYEKTKGNPLFVEEIIKSFFNKKYIYVDEVKGYWTKDHECSNFIIPSDMHGVLLNQIKDMRQINIDILKIISIFQSAVSIEIIKSFIENHYMDINNDFEGLISSGILCRKIEDRGFVFDFYNKFLKNLMYEKICDEDRKAMHTLASTLLQHQYVQGFTEYIDELIYHLEKSNQHGKIIDYCIENAEKMKILKNRSDAIKNLTRAITIMHYSGDNIKNIKIIMDLAALHEQEGHIDLAINYYLSIDKYKEDTELHKFIIDSLIQVAAVYLGRNDIDRTVHYIEKVQTMLENIDYLSGKLKCQGILASVYDIRQEYNKVQTICDSYLELCIGEYEELKSIFYNHKGLAFLRSGRVREALLIFEKNIVLCNKYNNIVILIKSLNNIGVIYGQYYQDDNKAIRYFMEIKDICKKNNMSSSEIDVLINIGSTYFSKEHYIISLQYFVEALEKCKKYEYESNIFYCYSSISSVYLKLGNYANAYKYYELCKRELESYPDQGKDIGEFYFLASKINYKFGDLKKAQFYIQKALKLYEKDESIFKWRALAINQYIVFYLRENDECTEDNIQNIITIAGKISSMENRLNIFYDIILFLYENDKKEYISIILYEIGKIDTDIKDNRVYVKKLYVDGLMEKKKGIKFLSEAIEYSKRYKQVDIYWKIYTSIGDYYFDKKDYLYAVIYYFEACGILKDIIFQLPVKYRLSYMELNSGLKPFNRFLAINNYYKSNKDSEILEFKPIKVSDENELLYLLEQVNHKDILKNKNFIKSIKKIYSSSLRDDIHDISDVLGNLGEDNAKNLELIIDYLSYITLATRATIIIADNDQDYKVIAASDRKNELPQNEEILYKIFSRKKPSLVTDVPIEQNANGIHNTLKASICIPIIMGNTSEKEFIKSERRKNSHYNKHVIGYVYIESQRVLNNLNSDSMKKCMELSNVIGIVIEKYKLRLSASIDKLTGTLTRKYLEEALDEQIELSSQTGGKFSLIMYDLDHFKRVNDKFGHRTGDYALKRVCAVVMNNLRETDIVGRYGGEEFIVILPDTDICDAEILAEKLRYKIEDEKILDNRRDLTVSLGIATYPLHGEWQDELVERVDKALYVAKEQGRNRYSIWNSEFSKKAKRTDRLTGIISGNAIQDHRNVLAMIELIELTNAKTSTEDKIYSLLGRIIEITEANNGILFIMENEDIIQTYSRKILKNEWIDTDAYNKDIIESVFISKQGVFKIDWDTITEYDRVTGGPNWQSVMAIPLIQGDVVKGVLYLTESTTIKEFSFEDFNFVNILGKIIVPIL